MTEHRGPPNTPENRFLTGLVGKRVLVGCATGESYVGELLFLGRWAIAVQPDDHPQPVMVFKSGIVSIGRYAEADTPYTACRAEHLG